MKTLSVLAGAIVLLAGCGEMTDKDIIKKLIPSCVEYCSEANKWVLGCEGKWNEEMSSATEHPGFDEALCLQTKWDCGDTEYDCSRILKGVLERQGRDPADGCQDNRHGPDWLPFTSCEE